MDYSCTGPAFDSMDISLLPPPLRNCSALQVKRQSTTKSTGLQNSVTGYPHLSDNSSNLSKLFQAKLTHISCDSM